MKIFDIIGNNRIYDVNNTIINTYLYNTILNQGMYFNDLMAMYFFNSFKYLDKWIHFRNIELDNMYMVVEITN